MNNSSTIKYLTPTFFLIAVVFWLRVSFNCFSQTNFIDIPPKPETSQLSFIDSSGEVRLDISGIWKIHQEFDVGAQNYFQEAIRCVADQGKWPTRKDYTVTKFQGIDQVPAGGNDFPIVVRLDQTFDIPIEILILPDPEVVRACGIVERDFKKLEESSTVRKPEDWRTSKVGHHESVKGEEFFVPIDEFPKVVLPTPKNTKSLEKGLPWSGRHQTNVSIEEFNHFPEYWKYKDNALWQGILITDSVFDENFVVRWVSLRSVDNPNTGTWIAYAIVDACGAYSLDPSDSLDIFQTFIRPISVPFKHVLKVNDEGLLKRAAAVPVEYNLLQIPTPQRLVNKEKVHKLESADHTICEQYYAEHKKPIWKLTIAPDSKPFREKFHIRHALDESGEFEEVWKLIAFTTVKPKDLIAALAKLKDIEPTTIALNELEAKFDALNEIRESLLNK